MVAVKPSWVAGAVADGPDVLEIRNPDSGDVVGTASLTSPEAVELAVAAADEVRRECAALPAHQRSAALRHVSHRLADRREDFAETISGENGKPIKWARTEVGRTIATFRLAAEEANRFSGHLQRLDTEPGSEGRTALVRRQPRGPILAITPFNFPLNLVAHKVAPAIAVGAPVVIKPAPATPLTALLLGEVLAETDLPAGAWSVVVVPNEDAGKLVVDPRLPVVSFTGSERVGWAIADQVPRKHVTLELGGNAAVLVCADYSSDDDLDFAAQRIAMFGMGQAGQTCIGVQRVYAERSVYPRLKERILAHVGALGTGPTHDDRTDVGPVINEAAAERIEQWVDAAIADGARALTGGRRSGSRYEPTVLEGAPDDALVNTEEIFGPVLTIAPVDAVEEGLAKINESRYGLQAGLFTRNVQTIFRADRTLELGGLIVGDVPSYRADQMPYGGVKQSGVGREGVRAAMEDLTEERVLVLTGVDL